MSLRQIAQNLGLSITTVSRALAGYSDVSATTRQRVQAEAERIHYVPNEVARRLQRGRADAIGFVVPGNHGFDDRFFLNIIAGLWARLGDSGVDLLVMAAAEGPGEMRAYRRLVEGGRIDGLILPRVREQDPRIEYLCEVGFPFVAFGANPGLGSSVPWLDIDTEQAIALALDHLVGLGHARIGFVGPDKPYRFARAREAAFLKSAAERKLEPSTLVGSIDEAGGYDTVARAIAAGTLPTALIAATDRIGVGATRALRDAGIKVGTDVSILTFGDNPVVQFADPRLTAIRLPTQEMSNAAADYLISKRDGVDRSLKSIWPTELVVRESTGPVRGWAPRSELHSSATAARTH